ncbi:MAG: metallophosphoesterase [bacterium]|jgi:predicted MPP superfamily phosphohydrolase|nr:metallophosphoesterase [bacterium]
MTGTQVLNQTPQPQKSSRRQFIRRTLFTLAGTAVIPSIGWAQSEPLIRIGLVTDLHYADTEPRGNRIYRESLGKLADCIEVFKTHPVNVVIELGDFKDQDPQPEEQKTLAYLKTIEAQYQQLGVPLYHVLGNHDMDSLSKAQFLETVKNTGIPQTQSYYSFDLQRVHCIVLDANFRHDGVAYNHGNYDWTDANLPPDELDWLKADLARTTLPTLVFTHQLLDGTGDVYVKNAKAVRTILEESNRVRAVLQGHHHAGQINTIQSILYYTLKSVVEGPGEENNACAVVEVMPDAGLHVIGYFRAEGYE